MWIDPEASQNRAAVPAIWQMIEETKFFVLELRVSEAKEPSVASGATNSASSSDSSLKHTLTSTSQIAQEVAQFRVTDKFGLNHLIAVGATWEEIDKHWAYIKSSIDPQLQEVLDIKTNKNWRQEFSDILLIKISTLARIESEERKELKRKLKQEQEQQKQKELEKQRQIEEQQKKEAQEKETSESEQKTEGEKTNYEANEAPEKEIRKPSHPTRKAPTFESPYVSRPWSPEVLPLPSLPEDEEATKSA